MRIEALKTHPELRGVLERLAGLLNDKSMQRLNFEVDEKKKRPNEVARSFLESQGLLDREK